VSNPWTVLGPGEAADASRDVEAADSRPVWGKGGKDEDSDSDAGQRAAWRGTIQAKTDGDIWLAAAFADYQSLVAAERGMAASREDKCLCDSDHDKAATSMHSARARYLAAARASGDVALSKVVRRFDSSDWYDIASGKGVLVLSELRLAMGDGAFEKMMDDFGRRYAGQAVATADFISAANAAAGRDLGGFFGYWLEKVGLPTMRLGEASVGHEATLGQGGDDERLTVRGVLSVEGGPMPSAIEATAEWEGGETTQVVPVEPSGAFRFACERRPSRLVVDKYERSARANGGAAGLGTFTREIEKTIIVYGTAGDEAGNRDAALKAQRGLQQSWLNWMATVKADTEVTDGELRSNSVVLIGRPSTNNVAARAAKALPVEFGDRSFAVRGEWYGNPLSAVIAAAASPWNERMSVTIVAGNDAESTVRAVDGVRHGLSDAEVAILTRDGEKKSVVVPAAGLVKEFGK
jgi:hypothetical protein